jgi:cell shape-determining protein MreC
VALLVIASMLNAAGIVVFVNKAQPLQPQLNAVGAQLAATTLTAAANLNARQKAEDAYNAEVLQHQKDNSNNQAAIAAVQSQLNEARVTIARLQSDNTDLQAGMNTANNNVQLANSTSNKLQEQVTQLRTTNDKLARENEEFGRHNAELTSTLDSLQARQEQTQEQLAQEKEDEQKLRGALKTRGVDPDAIVNAPAAADLGAPSIEGVVREKSQINGNTFVTISVGSQDGVAKGMRFYVVNGADFLGIVTIDTVDSDNSIGKLEAAPGKGDAVQKGDEVKTQLRGS